MKIRSILATFASIALAASSATAGLVAHYTFDDPSNLSTNTGSATLVWNQSAGVAGTNGMFAGAGAFVTGTSQYWMNDFSPAAADLSNFSVSMHVRGNNPPWDDYVSIGIGTDVLVLERNGIGSCSLYSAGNPEGTNSAALGGSTTITNGNWHHIGVASDGSTVELYIDGVSQGSSPYVGTGTITSFQIASRFGDGARAITADIDDVAVYDTALSAGQMSWLAGNVAVDSPPDGTPAGAVLTIVSSAGSVTVGAANLSASASNTLQVKTDLTGGSWSNLYSFTGVTETNWVISTTNQSFFRIEAN